MAPHSAAPTWHPRTLIRQALNSPLTPFVASLDAQFLLLITLDNEESELAVGLRTQDALRNPADCAPFHTVPATLADPPSAAERLAPTQRNSPDRLPAELLRKPCHVAPIQKSGAGSFLQHVSIGRARNHDIVLRQDSVSKFHAWFELHEGGRLFVKDCDSRNHTFVDKERVSKRQEVHPGQTVTFGLVECRVCTPASLWAALHD